MNPILKTQVFLFILLLVLGCGNKRVPDSQASIGEPGKDGIDRAMLHEFLMTRDPKLNRIPRERLAIVQQMLENDPLARNAQTAQTTAALTWQERGPTNI